MGKTIAFSELTNKIVQKGNKVLILAHRGELLEQAQTKLGYFNIDSSLEKGTFTADSNAQVVVASVQSLSRDNRLEKFPKDYFKTIIIDECHHSMSDTYKKIINYFDSAYVLGVTATPDRADEQDLSEIFPVTAFEYSIEDAIKDGFLSPIKIKFVKTKLNLKDINFRNGDYAPEEVGAMLENSLEKLAKEIKKNCKDRKTVVFVPLVSTARKFEEIFNNLGMKAISIAGEDKDRKERIEAFANDKYNIAINSMLLTEGWDCPSVNCVVCLRPTESRSLMCQIIGRGLRLSPETNKQDCLVLDFLWLTGHHSLCRPASLFTDNLEIANQVSSKKQDIETMDELFDEIEEAKEVVEEKKKQLEMERTNSMLKKVQEASDNAERLQYFKDNGVDDTICKGCVNPGYFVKLVVSKEEQGDFYRTKYGKSRDFNFEHLKYLASKGIKATDISTSEMENYLYDLIIKRENQKLASPKQIFILSLKKIQTNYSTVTSSQASFLLRSKK